MRQLLIGLDAMEWDLVRDWARSGQLPVFQRLLETGYSAELSTTAEQLPDTVWPSIYTGTNPARYGKYFYCQYDAERGDLKMLTDDDIHCRPFWQSLSEAGRRVAVIDAPKFPLFRDINGLQLTNWGAHATRTALATSPPDVLPEILAKFGRHPVADCDKVGSNCNALRDLSERVREGVEAHGKLFRWAWQRENWDVFFASFSAPHCIGHHYWSHMDTTHPLHEAGDPDGLASAIPDVYRAIDKEIGLLLDLAGDDVQVMIFAGHGMGPIYHASWNLMEILDLLGYGRSQVKRAPADEALEGKKSFWRILKMLVPGGIQYAIKNALPSKLQHELLFRWYAGNRDWAGRKAIAVPNNDSVGAIRIQVEGRDKHGVVKPADYSRICDDIRDALMELVDPETGRRVVRRVTLTHEDFSGPFRSALPDITVLWDQRFAWDTIESPRLGRLRIRSQDSRSGSHTPHGFVIAAGAGVQPQQDTQRRSIYDITPTVLKAAGVSIWPEIDGDPLPFVVKEAHGLRTENFVAE